MFVCLGNEDFPHSNWMHMVVSGNTSDPAWFNLKIQNSSFLVLISGDKWEISRAFSQLPGRQFEASEGDLAETVWLQRGWSALHVGRGRGYGGDGGRRDELSRTAGKKKPRLYIGYHCSKIWNDVRYVDMYVCIYIYMYMNVLYSLLSSYQLRWTSK